MQFQHFTHLEELLDNLFFLQPLQHKEENFSIALSGGTTPGPLYQAIAHNPDLRFENIEFFQVDERYVPSHDPASNYRMIQENLLANLPHPCKGLYSFDTALTIEDALKTYKEDLMERSHPYFDLTILGMGSDGHIASLFPHSPALYEEQTSVAHTITEQFAIPDRLTLTLPAIFASKAIIVFVRGEEKKAQVEELKNFSATSCPSAVLSFDSYGLPQFTTALITPEMANFPAKTLVYHPNVTVLYCAE